MSAHQTVVVDLSIDGENDGFVRVGQGLCAGLCTGGSACAGWNHSHEVFGAERTNTNDTETLMAED